MQTTRELSKVITRLQKSSQSMRTLRELSKVITRLQKSSPRTVVIESNGHTQVWIEHRENSSNADD